MDILEIAGVANVRHTGIGLFIRILLLLHLEKRNFRIAPRSELRKIQFERRILEFRRQPIVECVHFSLVALPFAARNIVLALIPQNATH